MQGYQTNKEEIKQKQENGKGFHIHSMKTLCVAVQIHSSLTWALDGDEWSASPSGHFAFEKKSRLRNWVGFISGLDILERSNVSLTSPRIEHRIVQSVAWKLYSLQCTGVMQCEVKVVNNI
jgi:hypothetical protein